MKSKYRYCGQFCNFDFYVLSLNTSQNYSPYEPLVDHLTLDEAVAEYKRRNPYSPDDIMVALGANFSITAPEYMNNTVNIGDFDLLQRVNGEHRVPNDFMTDKALSEEKLISVNAIRIVSQLADELSGRTSSPGLTEAESKLLHEHLVTASDDTELHDNASEVAAEIVHHNEMEDNGDVPDDERSL